MILIKYMTPLVKYEKLKIENHYHEMLTATVSHDMRTPLNTIIGLYKHVAPYVQNDEAKKYLRIINNSSNILLFLVNDLLDFF